MQTFRVRSGALLARILVGAALVVVLTMPIWAGDVSGTWQGQLVLGQAKNVNPIVLSFKQDGQSLTGTISFCKGDCSTPGASVPIENGKIDGSSVSFSFPTDAPDVPRMDLQGTVNGDSIQFVVNGNAQDCMAASCQIGTGTATKKK